MVDNLCVMIKEHSLHYHRTEIESFLPTGWSLNATAGENGWNAETQSWLISLFDGADFEWPLAVKASDASRLGRIEALKAAIDRTYRARLGDHTRGLGRG